MYYFYERSNHLSILDINICDGGWQYHGLLTLEEILSYIKQTLIRWDTYSNPDYHTIEITKDLFARSWGDIRRFLLISSKGFIFSPRKNIILKAKYHRYYWRTGRKYKWRKCHYKMHRLLVDAKNPENKEFIRRHFNYSFWEEDRYREMSKSWKDQSKKRKQWM